MMNRDDAYARVDEFLSELSRGETYRISPNEFAALLPDDIRALARKYGLRCTYGDAKPDQFFAPGGAAF